jgi:hypothetical protein
MPSSVDLAIQQVGSVLSDFGQTIARPDGPAEVLALLGWSLPPGAADIGLAALDFSGLVTAVENLDTAISQGTTGLALDEAFTQVGTELVSFIQGVDAAVAGFSASGDYLTQTDIVNQFVPRLLDYLIVKSLQSTASLSLGLFMFTGVVQMVPYDADPTIYQVQHIRYVMNWNLVPQLFGNIKGLLAQVFQWGVANADPTAVVLGLGTVISGLTSVTQTRALPRRAEAALVGHDVPEADTDPMPQLLLSITKGLDVSGLDVGVSLIGLRPTTAGGTDMGVAFLPYIQGSSDLTIPMSDTVTFSIDTTLDVADGIALIFRAGSGATIRNNLLSGGLADVVNGHILATFTVSGANNTPMQLLTVADGLGITVGSVGASAGVDISAGQLGALLSVALTNAVLNLSTANLDSFLATIIPIDVTLGFSLTLGWSSAHGLFIEGNASPQYDISLNTDLGPFHLDTLHLALTLGQPDLPLEVSFDGSATLGPLDIAVQRLGLSADLKFQRGNLGPVDLGLDFKPPTGLGIQIDAGLAAGGGFIFYDPAHGRYAGILDVTLADIVSVKVITVLDTQLPNGATGFSFLMIITFDFPPVNIGFGFTINGVGGLGGVNRTMVIDALQAGLRAHDLDNILFPADPVDNAPQIISEMESFFPPAQGRYLFGPMFSIGWGTPTLLDFEVGVILEVPDPVRLAILGEITATIPSPEFALISLRVQVLGTIDFGTDQLAIDGTMYDSYLLAFQLSGDMAMRLNWGSNANFLFSLGGFNPQFQPPPGVPALSRLSVSIGSGSNPRLSASSYFAVTSNTLQFGANIDAYASAGGFAVHGYVGFDVLFIFSPFSFEADFSAGFSISYDGDTFAGIQLSASLSGPNPWHLHGTASLQFLFFSVGVSIDLTWGDSSPATLPNVAVLPLLTAALADPANWSAQPPAAGPPGVSLRALPAGSTGPVVVQPSGTLSVRETVVPLDITITKVNNAQPTDGSEFSISAVTLNGTAVATVPQQEDFAIAQFTDMSDAAKLSAPSYELFDAGVSLGAVPMASGHDSAKVVAYTERYIDDYELVSRFGQIYQMPASVHEVLAADGAAAVAPIRTTGLAGFASTAPSPLTVSRMSYLIASTTDLTQRADILASATTHYEAQAALAAFLAANPDQWDSVQVIPAYEVAT